LIITDACKYYTNIYRARYHRYRMLSYQCIYASIDGLHSGAYFIHIQPDSTM